MSRTLAAVALEVEGELVGDDAPFGDVTIDSRRLSPGGLFVAVRGERADGHDFVAHAHANGAAGALVSRLAEVPLAQVRVGDTRRALGRMARAWRARFDIPTVAVTGSNGKTTVKELIAAILAVHRRVCVTQGNLNNELGVPLTLMTLRSEHEALVVELGANHAGEIGYLSDLAQPTVGVITNANAAHLEGFGSLAGVASAKGELLDHLPRAGTAVLNADDPFCADWRARARTETVLTFGLSDRADCTVIGTPRFADGGSHFTMKLPDGSLLEISLPLLGRHNVVNALAAAAAAQAAGVSVSDIPLGLAQAHPVRGRLEAFRGRGGALIVDDSYNANPASVRTALDYLAGLGGERVLVLGDMAELGSEARALHRDIGAYAAGRCDQLIGVGELAREAVEAFGARGRWAKSLDDAASVIDPLLEPATTVLVKGSRTMGLERLVARLKVTPQDGVQGRC